MALAAFLLALFLSEPATLHDGRCSACEKWHVRSTVTMSVLTFCAAMDCGGGYYDEDGKYVTAGACSTCTTYGQCSRGHTVIRVSTK